MMSFQSLLLASRSTSSSLQLFSSQSALAVEIRLGSALRTSRDVFDEHAINCPAQLLLVFEIYVIDACASRNNLFFPRDHGVNNLGDVKVLITHSHSTLSPLLPDTGLGTLLTILRLVSRHYEPFVMSCDSFGFLLPAI